MRPTRVWITGVTGLIGSHLARTSSVCVPQMQVIGLTRQQLDLTDFHAVCQRFQHDRPGLVIHCAALSRSRVCQADPALARRLNVEVTVRLAELAAEIPFVFFSSDLVFDGRKGAYVETDTVNPLSVYGETKVEAERLVLTNPMHTVIRTSLNGGASPKGDRSFNEEMRSAWRSGKSLNLFTDEFRSPIAAAVTARAVWELALQGNTGLFHVAGNERLSRWQIGELVAARWPQLHPKIERASLKSYTGGPRPADTSLDCAKAQKLLSFPLPGLSDWLRANPDEVF